MDNDCSNHLETVIDRILFSARSLKDKMKAIKESDPDNGLGDRTSQYKNTKRIQDLERENFELKQALEDHQYGLEFIMSKYRSQVFELMKLNKLEKNNTPPQTLGSKDEKEGSKLDSPKINPIDR